ncbi:MAG: flagellar biosynthetic protein FliR [Gemmatimonadales bacterium]|nr:MAG: flagellar biosynthetic protein FliR [Gemmatimonadales bacterium]
MILDAFLSPGGTSAAALLLFRITGLLAVAPMFSARFLPLQLKAAFTVLLVMLLLPAGLAAGGADVAVTPEAMMGELVVGFTLGFAAGILVHAAEVAGDFIAVQTGLSGANLLDPLSQTQMPVLGQFMGLAALTTFLAVGGHRVVLESAALSMQVIPPGAGIHPDGILPLVETGSMLFSLGLRMAAPVIAAVTIGNVALGVLARTVPQMNVLMTAFPLQIGIGLLVLSVSIPLMGGLFTAWPTQLRELGDGLLIQMAPDPGGPR